MARTSKTWAGRHTAGLPNAENTAAAANATSSSSSAAASATATSTTGNNKPTKQPKSVLDKIIFAIRQQPGGRSSKGVSRQTISKYLKAELNYDNANAIKSALKKGVEKGQLEQNGQSFRVKGDPVVKSTDDAAAAAPQLQVTDLVVPGSEGAVDTNTNTAMEAQVGDSVTVKYIGKLEDGHQFDAAPSFTFVLGAGDVIKGWDRGLEGMKVGGKRKLVVPSQLGYGKRGCAPDIPGDATLHFVVTMKGIDRPQA